MGWNTEEKKMNRKSRRKDKKMLKLLIKGKQREVVEMLKAPMYTLFENPRINRVHKKDKMISIGKG